MSKSITSAILCIVRNNFVCLLALFVHVPMLFMYVCVCVHACVRACVRSYECVGDHNETSIDSQTDKSNGPKRRIEDKAAHTHAH